MISDGDMSAVESADRSPKRRRINPAMVEGYEYRTIVSGLNGDVICEVTIDLTDAINNFKGEVVGMLKQAIENSTQVPMVEQQLCHFDTLLHDRELPLSLQIPNAPLQVMLNVPPWTDEEIESARECLTNSAFEGDVATAAEVLLSHLLHPTTFLHRYLLCHTLLISYSYSVTLLCC